MTDYGVTVRKIITVWLLVIAAFTIPSTFIAFVLFDGWWYVAINLVCGMLIGWKGYPYIAHKIDPDWRRP